MAGAAGDQTQSNPVVSFVVPCYKLAHMLAQCVQSLLAQTFQDFEILIMDNCSPDETPAVAASFRDSRVKYIRNEVNLGHVRNFNRGITLARGKYVWLISADDALRSSHALERFVAVMEQNPSVGYVFCRVAELRNGKDCGIARWADCGENDRIWEGHAFLARLIEFNRIVMSSGMVRKECYERVSLFPEDLPHAGDWYMWSVFALHHKVAYVAEPMVYWRVHEESLTSQYNREDGRICRVDELNALWRLGSEAARAGVPSLQEACRESFVERAALALRSEQRDPGTGLCETDLGGILHFRLHEPGAERDFLARIATALGDKYYADSECRQAARAYRRAIRLRPAWLQSWAKYLLSHLGGIGRYARRLITASRRTAGVKRNVLFVINSSAFGGAERHLIELLRRLDDADVNPSILSLGPEFQAGRLEAERTSGVSMRCEQEPASLRGWLQVLRNPRPDVVVFVYSWLWTFPWYALVAAKLAGIKKRYAIQHLFASPLPPPDPRRRIRRALRRILGGWSSTLLALRASSASCGKTICVSDAVRESLVGAYRFPVRSTITIHNGVAVSEFVPSGREGAAVRSRLGFSPQDFVLVCAARLNKVKGIDILLRAVHELARGGTKVKCIIAGDGPLREDLEAQARTLGLAGAVIFTGLQKDVKPYLQAADVFVLTSHNEGLPLSVLEAMACGLPCVVTNVGGNAEAVTDGVNGFVVPRGSVAEAVRAISYLATHPQERERMSRMARARACEAFDIDDRMAEMKRVLLA